MIERPGFREAERIIGLDLSKKTFTGCILTKEECFIKHHPINGVMDANGQARFITTLKEGDWVAIEGGTSSSSFARNIIRNSPAKVFMLNPAKLHIIFQTAVKTDRKDAVKIVELMRDMDPANWPLIEIPTAESSGERMLISQWIFLKEERTKHINRLHAVFNQCGIPCLKKSDLKYMEKRHSLAEYYLHDNRHADSVASMLCEQINLIELQLEAMEDKIREEIILQHPEEALSWLSLPGVGLITAASCIAYADNCSRFDNPRQLRNYVGLIPRVSQSGERNNVYGVNAFGCKPIRRHIIQAAWSVSTNKTPNTLTSLWMEYEARGKTGQKAAVAIANKLLTIGFFLVKDRNLYNGFGDYSYLEKKLYREKLSALRTSMNQMLKRTDRLA